jgi:hypothetical protein
MGCVFTVLAPQHDAESIFSCASSAVQDTMISDYAHTSILVLLQKELTKWSATSMEQSTCFENFLPPKINSSVIYDSITICTRRVLVCMLMFTRYRA